MISVLITMSRVWIFAILAFSLATAQPQSSSVTGNWANPSGSVIQIYRCGAALCAKLIAISAHAPGHIDANNPNPALRNRPLCDMTIGTGFEPSGPDRAKGGKLYDPESGKTYTGTMTREGNKLKLRGYIGIPLFGRTETWTRAPDSVPICHL